MDRVDDYDYGYEYDLADERYDDDRGRYDYDYAYEYDEKDLRLDLDRGRYDYDDTETSSRGRLDRVDDDYGYEYSYGSDEPPVEGKLPTVNSFA